MVLKILNTASGEKEEFKPLEENKVKMYVCGVTVYDDCHVGHARSYVAFDTIRRYLIYKGYDVKYVQNFTDIDDKIIARSNERGIETSELTEHFIDEYFKDMHRLNIQDADVYPKATGEIPEMIRLVETLIDKGYAYVSGGNVYFSILKAKDKFGTLCHQDIFDMLDGARVDPDEFKDYPKDFALWKKAKENEPFWDSPWGNGRPGWHVECSVMSSKYLGDTFDIHGGGMDLIFPHHESEILQSECANGVKFVNYWLHNGFVTVDEEKMSKSLGNFSTIKQILDQYDPMVMRFFLVYTHYRSPIDFSDENLDEAKQGYSRLKNFVLDLKDKLEKMESSQASPYDEEVQNEIAQMNRTFTQSMDDDFNTRMALAGMFEFVRLVNRVSSEQDFNNKQRLQNALEEFLKLSEVLGLKYEDDTSDLDTAKIDELVKQRDQARADKNWAEADRIRDELTSMGITIEDSADGTKWKKL